MDKTTDYYLFGSEKIKCEINLTRGVVCVTMEGKKSWFELEKFKSEISRLSNYIQRLENGSNSRK